MFSRTRRTRRSRRFHRSCNPRQQHCRRRTQRQYHNLPSLIFFGSASDVKLWLRENDEDPDTALADGTTPLMLAAMLGYIGKVRYLLNAGANKDAKTTNGRTALWFAKQRQHTKIMHLLDKEATSPPDENHPVSLDNLLCFECGRGNGNLTFVKVLLLAGANKNCNTLFGDTPPMLACTNGHFDIVDLFIQIGFTNYRTPDTGHDALMNACSNGHLKIMNLLLDAGAPATHKCALGYTLLAKVARTHKGVSEELLVVVIHKLLEKGVNVNDKNANGFTALFFACGLGRVEVVRMLLKAGADIDAMTNDGTTALMRASEFGYPDIVALLMMKDVNIYATTKAGDSALILASKNGHTTTVEILLKAGAAKNDSDLAAALLAASRNGHTTCSRVIVDWCKHKDTMANVRANLQYSKVFSIYRDGYNHTGFDNYGRDRDGYDRYGFDHRNFDRNGYNREGYDRNYRDRDGYNYGGFDRHGFDRDGYDIEGYDRVRNKR